AKSHDTILMQDNLFAVYIDQSGLPQTFELEKDLLAFSFSGHDKIFAVPSYSFRYFVNGHANSIIPVARIRKAHFFPLAVVKRFLSRSLEISDKETPVGIKIIFAP